MDKFEWHRVRLTRLYEHLVTKDHGFGRMERQSPGLELEDVLGSLGTLELSCQVHFVDTRY